MAGNNHYPGGDVRNYGMFGAKFLFNRLMDDTLTPARYLGFRDLGNIVVAGITPTVTLKEHYSSRSGQRLLDRKLTQETKLEFSLTLDEPNARNCSIVLRGGEPAVVAAATPAVVDEVVRMVGTEIIPLQKAQNGATAVVVKDITGVTTYDVTDDYLLVDVPGFPGWKGVQRVGTGDIADGDYVRVSYTGAIRAHRSIKPVTSVEIKGQGILVGCSTTGNEFIWPMQQVQLEPDGEIPLNDQDWSQFKLKVTVLDDSDLVPTAPYGDFEHHGVGTGL